ncbi:CUB domain-containing protein 1-like [Hyperolius riggenbachi]|uniref:CUB domain-containing protein 1-like n=1 Tax=Hyperolius riggenbachi TaxID=752182 RepID=UPI0035A366A4
MLLLGVFLPLLLLPHLSESVTISLQPRDNTIISIRRGVNAPSPACFLCVKNTGNSCKDVSLSIRSGETVDYSFSCTSPERHFIMEINRTIDCDLGTCPLNVSQLPSSLPVVGLNRTFIWQISALKSKGLILAFTNPWLRQIDASETCSDRIYFNISTFTSGSSINLGTFCKNGAVTRIKVLERGVVALSLPWDQTIQDPIFSVANRSSIKRLCIIETTFQTESLVTLLSANFPSAFPSTEHMTWKFNLPPNYAATVKFENYTLPVCEKHESEVQYYLPKPSTLKLYDKQPANIQSNFNFSLQNCIVDTKVTSQPGLTLKFNVIIQKTDGNIMYPLDLTKEKDLRVRISKSQAKTFRKFSPVCEICKGASDCDTTLEIEGGKYYKISFVCQDMNSLSVTAEKEISCWNLAACNISNLALNIPESFIDFPVRLESFTWKLIAPEYISTEITSKSIYIQQDTEDKPCNVTASGFTYEIYSSNNKNKFKIGTFCPNGSIQEVQMRDNVTVVLNMPRTTESQKLLKHDLLVSFVSFIKEECIITVLPKPGETIQLQTPNWEAGLPDYVSLSWNIKVPNKQSGRLKFPSDKMDVVCEMGRAYVNIKEEQDYGPGIVRREDQQLPGSIDLPSSFWVNVSNCKTYGLKKKLKLKLSVTFSPMTPGVKTILIAAGAALAVVVLVIVTVCCVKKKKKQKESPVGIYNSEVNTEVPRRQAFFKKGRKTNESHVYAVIDDTMVYGHLLQETDHPNPDVDVYRPFEGPMGEAPPVPPLKFPNGSSREDKVEDPLAHSMKENEIYTISEPILRQPVENEDTSIPYIEESENGTI